ncbi:MAG: exopolysaccharide biosynthesis protein [Acidimicrobiales bacterium]|nr:exopolysaccharide biosynthesis protein [Acidimicrobiales bacterium]
MALIHSEPPTIQDQQAAAWPPQELTDAPMAPHAGRATALTCRLAKRAFDLTFALVALVVVAPVLITLVLLVRRDGGPALFRHTRIGRGGRKIGVYKLRSMTPDAEKVLTADPELHARYCANGYKLPADEDPRITALGRTLRASSLDELPQLFNVLRGEMSIVGPRPVVPSELSEYEARGAEAAYLSVRPGMTGAWQVSGRSLIGYDQRVALDAAYIEHVGLIGDLKILLRTVRVVTQRIGAH